METSKDTKSYHEQKYIDNTLRLRSILKTLPPFAKDYFRAIEPTTSARTRISYAYDIRVFFHFLFIKTIPSTSLPYRIWSVWKRLISRNIRNISKFMKMMRKNRLPTQKKAWQEKCLRCEAFTATILSIRLSVKIQLFL